MLSIIDLIKMKIKIKRPRGTRDFTPEDMHRRNFVRKQIESVFKRYNYQEILFPTIEDVHLFEIKSGGEIKEHMYVFEDKGKRKICLRPEATASVCRMFVDKLNDMKKPLKLYYFCPMFRYERPQKGRYREFWHMGIELIGSSSYESDAEVIAIAYKSLKNIGLNFDLEIGHLGILRGLMSELGMDDKIQNRVISYMDKNDMKRLRDIIKNKIILNLIKLKGGKEILGKAEKLLENYKNAFNSLMELKEILNYLDIEGIDYKINFGVGRGLEYYTGMVFEIRIDALGSESQICGGGRYDNLIELLGGQPTPATGFAFGFDRIMNALEIQGIDIPDRYIDLIIAPVNKEVKKNAIEIASKLRERFIVDMDIMDRKLGKILEYGNEINAKFALIIGSDDLSRNRVTLRNMRSGEQKKILITELIDKIDRELNLNKELHK